MKPFRDVFDSEASTVSTLPILHSCEAIVLDKILSDQKLLTNKCDVFEEDLLYAFYGIPSYRKTMEKATSNPSHYPVCFILDYAFIPDVDQLFPFDTGAFSKIPSVKKDHFHESIDISQLELLADIEDAKKVVEKFYFSNENYIRQRPQLAIDKVSILNAVAYGYASLIHNTSLTNYDTRVATIELIYKQQIELNKDSLIQIIVPAVYLDEDDIYDQLVDTYGIRDPLMYETIRGTPSEYFGVVYNLYLNFIRQNSLL